MGQAVAQEDLGALLERPPGYRARACVSQLAAAALALAACSSHYKGRRLGPKIDKYQGCAVDDRYVYLGSVDGIFKVERKGGAEQFVTDDTSGPFDMVPIDGALYWVDKDGVHVWDVEATTRRSLATFPRVTPLTMPRAIVRFGNRLCWGTEIQDAPSSRVTVDCLDLGSKTVSPWISLPGNSIRLASDGARLQGAVSSGTVLDITDPGAPAKIANTSYFPLGLAISPSGPVFLFFTDNSLKHTRLWVAKPTPHELTIPDGIARVSVVGDHTYLTGDAGISEIDLTSGTLKPVSGTHNGMLCGDSRDIYVRGEDGSLLELPNR